MQFRCNCRTKRQIIRKHLRTFIAKVHTIQTCKLSDAHKVFMHINRVFERLLRSYCCIGFVPNFDSLTHMNTISHYINLLRLSALFK